VVMRQTQRAAAGIQTLSGSVSSLCVWLGPVTTPDREPSVGESVSLFREPDAGNLPVRFDEREQETEPSQTGLRWRGESQVEYPPGDYSYCACSRLYSRLHLINQVGDDWALSGPSAGSGRHRLQGSESFLRTHPRQLCVVLVCHSVCHSYLGRNSLRG
jgi:hypothetical protein